MMPFTQTHPWLPLRRPLPVFLNKTAPLTKDLYRLAFPTALRATILQLSPGSQLWLRGVGRRHTTR